MSERKGENRKMEIAVIVGLVMVLMAVFVILPPCIGELFETVFSYKRQERTGTAFAGILSDLCGSA